MQYSVQYEVNIDKLNSAVSEFKNYVTALKEQHNLMKITLENLSSMWEGEAHDEYVSQYAEDMERMETIISLFENEFVNYISSAKSRYENAETEVKAIFNGISI